MQIKKHTSANKGNEQIRWQQPGNWAGAALDTVGHWGAKISPRKK